MNKKSLVTFLLLLPVFCFSQDEVRIENHSNHLYLELVGSGGLYSINYERIFNQNIMLRGGLSVVPKINSGDFLGIGPGFTFPVSVSSLFNISKSSFLELGLSSTYFYVDDRSFSTLGTIIGLRDQDSSKSNTVIRFFILPQYVIEPNPQFYITGGLSFGFLK